MGLGLVEHTAKRREAAVSWRHTKSEKLHHRVKGQEVEREEEQPDDLSTESLRKRQSNGKNARIVYG